MYTATDERIQRRLEDIGKRVQDRWSRTAAFLHRRPGRNTLIISIFPPDQMDIAAEVEAYLEDEFDLRIVREEGPDYVDIKAAP